MAANADYVGERSRDTSSHSNRTRSPLHPQLQQTKTSSRTGSASPALERKGLAEGMSTATSGTPGGVRSRAGNSSSRLAEQTEKSSLPKFGAWDANDPSSGDGFTVIFNKARDEKKSGGSARTISLHSDSATKHSEGLNDPLTYQRSSSSKWCGCFGSTSGEI